MENKVEFYAFITMVVNTIGSVAIAALGVLGGYIALKTKQLGEALQRNSELTRLTHDSTNSKMGAMLKVVESAAEARGVLAGRQAERLDPQRE